MSDSSAPRPRWFTATQEGNSQRYVERFRNLAEQGVDLVGEARFVDAMVDRGSRVLDAGCGAGRISVELMRRGHTVVGVDADPVLVEAAELDHPGPRYAVLDLGELGPATVDAVIGGPVDLTVCAGNVMVFLAPGSEHRVLENLCTATRPGGRVVLGFRRDEAYPFEQFAADLDQLAETGVAVEEQRFSTWQLDAFGPESEFVVSVLRVR